MNRTVDAYRWSPSAVLSREPVLDLDGPWPGLGVDWTWRATKANDPEQSTEVCWHIWTANYDYIENITCEYKVFDDWGEVAYWGYGYWHPDSYMMIESCAWAPSIPQKNWFVRLWQRVANRPKVLVPCVDG